MHVVQKPTRHYRAGEPAPISGIYKVTHNAHRAPHEVLVITGEKLPPCRTCKEEVLFQIVRPLDYLLQEWDFAGPRLDRKGDHERACATMKGAAHDISTADGRIRR